MQPEEYYDIGDCVWTGELGQRDWNRSLKGSVLLPLDDGRVAYVASRYIVGNVTVFQTPAGQLWIDTGSRDSTAAIKHAVQQWENSAVHTIVYTHGHLDHVSGGLLADQQADANGQTRPRVVAHANVPLRFDRYRRSAGWNTEINRRQFRRGDFTTEWPDEYRYPDETFHESLTLEIGGEVFELRHGKGETDDHTWIYAPARKLICAGDFIIWAAPNCGNPQKTQRFAREWAVTLREMQRLDAEILIPGHGPAVLGADRVQKLLGDTAEFLESIHDQTLALMNEGKALDDILHAVQPPQRFKTSSFLQPTYDDPEFLVRNIWRFYGGWYDNNPAHLKPAPTAELAREVASLAGGPQRLASRAEELMQQQNARLAGHLIEWAYAASPNDTEIAAVRTRILDTRAAAETSLMARGVYSEAADLSRQL